MMRGWIDDFGYAGRRLARSPGFSATALVILVLGIGVNTTAFSVVNSLLFQPPPFENPEAVVAVLQDSDDGRPNSTSYPAFEDIRRTEGIFESVSAFMTNGVFLEQDGALVSILAEFSTTQYMDVLGLAPTRGRWFDATEDDPSGSPAAVLTHKMWNDRLGADPDILGSTLRIGGAAVTVVGVGPEEFNGGFGPAAVDLWLSISAIRPTGGRVASLGRREDHPFTVRARLLQGVTIDQARVSMERLAAELEATYPILNTGRRMNVISAQRRLDPESYSRIAPAAGLIMGVVILVLIMGTMNLANLLLVRTTSRGREIAVRLALGAGRGRLIRVVLSEALLLAFVGGAGGLAVAWWSVDTLTRARLDFGFPVSLDIHLDASVLAFTAAISMLTGLVFGLVPALRVTSRDVGASLRDEAGLKIGARGRFGLTGILVVGQVAVSLLLLAVASVFVESLARARGADPGIAWERTSFAQVSLAPLELDFPSRMAMYERIEEEIEAIPEISEATMAAMLPAAQFGTSTLLVGSGVSGIDTPTEVAWNVVTEDYFEMLEVPVLHGRAFGAADGGGAEVALVSEAMARAYWGRSDVVGEFFHHENSPDTPVEIVGVVGDIVVRTLGEAPTPSFYRPSAQWGLGNPSVLFLTESHGSAVAAIRETLRAIDPRILLLRTSEMETHLGDTMVRQRLAGVVLTTLGLLALLLAVLGVYGVVSFAVSQRQREVGIRIALGAGQHSVVRLFVRDVAGVVIAGALIGLAVAIPAGRLIGQEFTGAAGSPVLIVGVGALLVSTALLATLIPAVRASRTDPRDTLRQE